MIVTLTLNPAVDKTIRIRQLLVGTVQRVQDSHLDPGGKGINVSRMVDRLGCPTIAFGFLGGEIGHVVEKALEDEGVQSSFVHLSGQTRLNVTVFDEHTDQGTSFYERGPKVSPRQLATLTNQVTPWLSACKVVVLGGSIPPGVPDDIYAEFVRLAREAGAKTILDSDGEPMRRGVAALPTLIKPNREEAARLIGHPLPDIGAVAEAALGLVRSGIQIVVISMGGDGAVLACDNEVWRAIPPPIEARSTVGSGDSMVAGLAIALAQGESPVEGLRLGTAAGAATAMVSGTALGSPKDVEALLPLVQIERYA